MEKMLTVIICMAVMIAVILLAGRIWLSHEFSGQVKRLFAASVSISSKTFKYAQLSGLPEPVQRYFRFVLKEGQPYISYAGITHDGLFKTGLTKPWIKIKGEQYATTSTPGFIWKGATSLFTARDMYIAGKGRLIVSLLNLIRVVDGRGPGYDHGELLRWLGESVLYPTNLLPSERLQWKAIDDHTAKLITTYRELELFFIVTFNEAGEITQLESKRYMDPAHLETWFIKLSDYKTFSQVKVPTKFEVLWKLAEGDFSYAKFTIQAITYNVLFD